MGGDVVVYDRVTPIARLVPHGGSTPCTRWRRAASLAAARPHLSLAAAPESVVDARRDADGRLEFAQVRFRPRTGEVVERIPDDAIHGDSLCDSSMNGNAERGMGSGPASAAIAD